MHRSPKHIFVIFGDHLHRRVMAKILKTWTHWRRIKYTWTMVIEAGIQAIQFYFNICALNVEPTVLMLIQTSEISPLFLLVSNGSSIINVLPKMADFHSHWKFWSSNSWFWRHYTTLKWGISKENKNVSLSLHFLFSSHHIVNGKLLG